MLLAEQRSDWAEHKSLGSVLCFPSVVKLRYHQGGKGVLLALSAQGPSPGAMCPWTDPPSSARCGSGLQQSQTSRAKASLRPASSHLAMAGLEYAAGGHDGGALGGCWLP
ncbi:hypothetical protein DPX16_19049 [Anabarilius grahami]|uniref:Uncharacterized protein n=1 Tax=Anabarilius grahami TaxID=495550 RepID=A0A3N0YVN1_ANAGA|nr:hypothetical protein DPX16_19049 [Anabarilius grahami]